MKIPRLQILSAICFLFFISTSCNYGTGPDGGAGDETEPTVEQKDRDFTELKKFADTALSDGKMEMELSQIAIENTGNRGVERLAEMIKNDHRKANGKLADILNDYEWGASAEMTEKQEQKIEELRETPEEEIDQRYLSMMIESHEKAIRKFEAILSHDNQGSNITDEELANTRTDKTGQSDQEPRVPNTRVTGEEKVPRRPMGKGSESNNTNTGEQVDDEGDTHGETPPTTTPNKDQGYETYTEVDGEADEKDNEMQAPYATAVGAPELKKWIDNTLPVLKKHLEQAKQVQSQL